MLCGLHVCNNLVKKRHRQPSFPPDELIAPLENNIPLQNRRLIGIIRQGVVNQALCLLCGQNILLSKRIVSNFVEYMMFC